MKNFSVRTTVLTFVCIGFGITISNAQAKGERPHKPPTFSELLKDLDKNEDGKLSAAEIKGPLKDDFEKIDTNEDGFITKEELDKAPKPKRKPNSDNRNE
jgi:Ca2+-binding EF-hand superfamily protein